MSTLASVGADVEDIEKKIAAAETKVAAAETKVAAAKAEVAAAETKVAAAETKTKEEQDVAKTMLTIALDALKTAQKGLDTSEEERKSQVSVLQGLNNVLNTLRHAELQTHQALVTTPTGAAGGAQAASGQGTSGGRVMGEQDLVQAIRDLTTEQKELRSAIEYDKTEQKSMSKASEKFIAPLLQGLGMSWSRAIGNVDVGQNSNFSWDRGEEACTIEAMEQLRKLLDLDFVPSDTRKVEFVDACRTPLVPLKASNKECSGKTDIAIRFEDLQHDDQAAFAFVIGMVELKTNTCPLNFYQQVLELIAMSRMSEFGQCIALLGTDLNEKWEVLFFDKANHIICQPFRYETHAVAFFKEKLLSIHSRVAEFVPLTLIAEDHPPSRSIDNDQDLHSFGFPHDTHDDSAQYVQDLARLLNCKFDAQVSPPSWSQRPDLARMYS